MTLFEQMGGEAALRKVISRFVDRMFSDVMIGFMFRRANRARIEAMEYQFAARHLGAPVQYSGKPLSEAHAPHAINGGQFNRRSKLLADTLEEMNVPSHVRAHWMRNTEALRNQVLSKSGTECASPEQPAPSSVQPTSAGAESAGVADVKGSSE